MPYERGKASHAPRGPEEVNCGFMCRSVEKRMHTRRKPKVSESAHTVPKQSGSEEDDYELQQALAMSLLDSPVPALPKSAHRGPPEPQTAQAGLSQAGGDLQSRSLT